MTCQEKKLKIVCC